MHILNPCGDLSDLFESPRYEINPARVIPILKPEAALSQEVLIV